MRLPITCLAMVALRRNNPLAMRLRADCGSAILAAALLVATGLPARAGTPFAPPQGCRLEVTVQNRGCTVTQQYRCEADAAGDQRGAVFTRDGLVYQSHIDAETRWLRSTNLPTGLEDVLVEDSADHASFSTLLREGRDDFDFWTRSNSGESLNHTGFDELTGRKLVVDGIELEETRFELTTKDADGRELLRRTGQQFLNRAMGRFYGGAEQISDWTGEMRNTNDTPALFSFPGEEGFGDTEPKFDCDQLMAQLRLQERPQQ